jgi:hypothetical protein
MVTRRLEAAVEGAAWGDGSSSRLGLGGRLSVWTAQSALERGMYERASDSRGAWADCHL